MFFLLCDFFIDAVGFLFLLIGSQGLAVFRNGAVDEHAVYAEALGVARFCLLQIAFTVEILLLLMHVVGVVFGGGISSVLVVFDIVKEFGDGR